MDHHTVAAISLVGITLDVLGGLYLAYDLLGGQHGPLRLLTRMVTYSLVFGIGYGLGMGLVFGAIVGLAFGITVAIELNRESQGSHYPLHIEALCSVIRGYAVAAAISGTVGLRFALAFGTLISAGQLFGYSRGDRPGMDYAVARRARFTRTQVFWTLVRTAGYIAAGLICSKLVRHVGHPWIFVSRLGVVTGLVTSVGIMFNPIVEYYADNLPERRLGIFGIALVFCGFMLQSIQYIAALLD